MKLSPAIAAALIATSLGSLISLIDPPAANAYRLFGWDSRYRRGERLHNIGVDLRYYANPLNRPSPYPCAYAQPGSWREDACRARYTPAPQSVEPYQQPIPRPVYYAAPMQSAPAYRVASQPVQVVRVIPTVAPAPVVRTSYTQPIPAYRATGSQTAGRGIWGFFE